MGNLKGVAMFLLLLVSIAKAHRHWGAVFDVQGNQILASAFKESCACPTLSKVLIREGIFMLAQVSLGGPYKSAVEILVRGTLKALTDPSKMKVDGSWVTFQRVDQLTLSGRGTFNRQGPEAWGTCGLKSYCNQLPNILRFNFITNGIVQDITSKDSKQFHVNVLGSNNLTFRPTLYHLCTQT